VSAATPEEPLDFDLNEYRRERNVRLQRENTCVRNECDQLTGLLALVARVAVGDTGVDAMALLSVAMELLQAEHEAEAHVARTIRALQETAG
jgi:hypothetical protein